MNSAKQVEKCFMLATFSPSPPENNEILDPGIHDCFQRASPVNTVVSWKLQDGERLSDEHEVLHVHRQLYWNKKNRVKDMFHVS